MHAKDQVNGELLDAVDEANGKVARAKAEEAEADDDEDDVDDNQGADEYVKQRQRLYGLR